MSLTGLKFQPDFIWIKSRAGSSAPGSQNHYLVDSVRGATGSVTKKLYSNSTGAEMLHKLMQIMVLEF